MRIFFTKFGLASRAPLELDARAKLLAAVHRGAPMGIAASVVLPALTMAAFWGDASIRPALLGWCLAAPASALTTSPDDAFPDVAEAYVVQVGERIPWGRRVATPLPPASLTKLMTALLVDEAHDFEESWLRLCTQLVDPLTRSLLVMYDDAQSIYQKKRRSRFTFAGVGIEAQGRRTQVLKLNYRNTREVLNLAVRCADALLRSEDETSDTATEIGRAHV